MKIYIVRHGETNLNKKRILQGIYDEPLNEEGILLAKISGKALKGIHFDEAFSSPLSRSVDTVKYILEESGNINTPIHLDSRIQEINVGDWALSKLDNKEDPNNKYITQFFSDPFSFLEVPNGENVFDVLERTKDFLFNLINRNDQKTYLIGTHGFAMRAMLNSIYENKEDFWHGRVPYNCCFNILEVLDGKIRIIEEDICYYDSEKKDYFKK